MSPNREVVTRFPFASSQWAAGSPTTQEESSPAAVSNGVDGCSDKMEIQDGDRLSSEQNGESINRLDDKDPVTSGLISAQRCISQLYNLRQSAEVSRNANHKNTQQVEKTPPINYTSRESEKTRHFLQTQATSPGNNNVLFSYGIQLPWTTANLAAVAANHQLTATVSNPAANLKTINQSIENRSVVVPALGDLLPPPPSLPLVNCSLQPKSCSASHPAYSMPMTTSKPGNYSTFANDSSSRFHTSVHIPQHANITSSKERSQPLDLSLLKGQRLETATNVKTQNGVAADANSSLNSNLPQIVNPPLFSSSSSTSSLTSQDAMSQQQQQIAITSNLLQNFQLISSLHSDARGNPDAFTDFTRDCLQKWLIAAQQRHQAVAVQQSTKQQRKRPISEEYSTELKRKRSFDDQASKSPKPRVISPNNVGAQGPGITGAVSTSNNGKRYKRYAKPPYSYVALITLAILSSSEKKLRLSQILKRISDMFPFFKGQYQGWRDSVRHNLSQNECFVKVLKNPYRPTAKGNYWSVTTSAISRDLMTRQNTLVSRYVQDSGYNYRKDLTEVFDCITGNIKIKIPSHLLSGTDLIDDPAVIMEALLLEPKGEEDSLRNNVPNLSGRKYSLVDMFDQNDGLDDDISRRQTYGTASGKWTDKATKSRRNSLPANSIPVTQSSNQLVLPIHSAVPSFAENPESLKLIEIIRNASKLMNPLTTVPPQNGLLSQAMNTTSPAALPLFLTMCNSAKQFQQQTNVASHKRTSYESESPPEVNAKLYNPPQEQTSLLSAGIHASHLALSPTGKERSWPQENSPPIDSSTSPRNFELQSSDESKNDENQAPRQQISSSDRGTTDHDDGQIFASPIKATNESTQTEASPRSPISSGLNLGSSVLIRESFESPVVRSKRGSSVGAMAEP